MDVVHVIPVVMVSELEHVDLMLQNLADKVWLVLKTGKLPLDAQHNLKCVSQDRLEKLLFVWGQNGEVDKGRKECMEIVWGCAHRISLCGGKQFLQRGGRI